MTYQSQAPLRVVTGPLVYSIMDPILVTEPRRNPVRECRNPQLPLLVIPFTPVPVKEESGDGVDVVCVGTKKVVKLKEGDEACECGEYCNGEIQGTHYQADCPNGHLYCYLCMDQIRHLTKCMRCSQPVFSAVAVHVKKENNGKSVEDAIEVD